MTAAQAAHLRLLSTLPVRTHERVDYAARAKETGRGIILRGIEYASISDAARKLHIGRESVRQIIRRGDGRFL